MTGGALLMAVLTIASVGAEIVWRDLPPLPQPLGGQFVETAGGRLVVADGSCLTNPPWAGGRKIWVDTIYTLGKHDMGWRAAARRPEPLAYGAAASVRERVLLFGGQGPASLSKTILLFAAASGKPANCRRLQRYKGLRWLTECSTSERHPGFRREVYAYDSKGDTWNEDR